jgi:hypothetical protein
MSAQGGNLSQPSKKVLFNVIDSSAIGAYYDTMLAKKVLVLKDHGYSIPFISGVTKVYVSHTTSWLPKVQLVSLTGNMPCVECNYDYGLSIRKSVKKPGVDNSDYYHKMTPYSGLITKPVSQAAPNDHLISLAQILTMKETIIEQINKDLGYKPAFPYEQPGTIVKAGKSLILDSWNAASAMTLNAGLTSQHIVAASGTIAGFIANINAGTTAYAYQHPTVATSIVIIAHEDVNFGNTLTFTNTAGTIANTNTEIYIGLIAKYTDVTFSVEMDPFWGTNFLEVQKNRYSQLTSDEVFQTFSHIPNNGWLAAMTRSNEPVDANFVKVTIINKLDHYDLVGASHANSFLSEVELYFRESELVDVTTNKFLSTDYMSTAGGYDKDFNELTEYWNGTATGWADDVAALPY